MKTQIKLFALSIFCSFFIFVILPKSGIAETMEKATYPIIGHFSDKDKLITLRAGIDGPKFTVMSSDGKILAEKISVLSLYNRFPKIKDLMERGFAWEDASLGPKTHK